MERTASCSGNKLDSLLVEEPAHDGAEHEADKPVGSCASASSGTCTCSGTSSGTSKGNGTSNGTSNGNTEPGRAIRYARSEGSAYFIHRQQFCPECAGTNRYEALDGNIFTLQTGHTAGQFCFARNGSQVKGRDDQGAGAIFIGRPTAD